MDVLKIQLLDDHVPMWTLGDDVFCFRVEGTVSFLEFFNGRTWMGSYSRLSFMVVMLSSSTLIFATSSRRVEPSEMLA